MGRQAELSLERKQSKKKKGERQKDECSLRSLTHCQIVNVKAHNYTWREQQTRENKERREGETQRTKEETRNVATSANSHG